MMRCEWCDEEIDGKWIAVVEGRHWNVCITCLNLIANQEYDKLIERLQIGDKK